MKNGDVFEADSEGASKLALRAGAYVVKVASVAEPDLEIFSFDEAKDANKIDSKIFGDEPSLETAIIGVMPNGTVFCPVSKVLKYLENGPEDNLHFYLQVLLRQGQNF